MGGYRRDGAAVTVLVEVGGSERRHVGQNDVEVIVPLKAGSALKHEKMSPMKVESMFWYLRWLGVMIAYGGGGGGGGGCGSIGSGGSEVVVVVVMVVMREWWSRWWWVSKQQAALTTSPNLQIPE